LARVVTTLKHIDPAEPRCPFCRFELPSPWTKQDVIVAYVCARCDVACVMEPDMDFGLKVNILGNRGAWDGAKTYERGERVDRYGVEWLAIRACPRDGDEPPRLSPQLDPVEGSYSWLVLPAGWETLRQPPKFGGGPRSRPSELADA
jgi:hypothetical protein